MAEVGRAGEQHQHGPDEQGDPDPGHRPAPSQCRDGQAADQRRDHGHHGQPRAHRSGGDLQRLDADQPVHGADPVVRPAELVEHHHPQHPRARQDQERQAHDSGSRGAGTGVREGGAPALPPQQPERDHEERQHRPRLHRDRKAEHDTRGDDPAPAGARAEQGQRTEQAEVHQRLEQRGPLGVRGGLPECVEQPRYHAGAGRHPAGDPPDQNRAQCADEHEGQPGHRHPLGVAGQPAEGGERCQHQGDAGRVQQQVVAVGNATGEQRVGRRVVDAVVVGQHPREAPAAQDGCQARDEGDHSDDHGGAVRREPRRQPGAEVSHGGPDERHRRRVPGRAGRFLGSRGGCAPSGS